MYVHTYDVDEYRTTLTRVFAKRGTVQCITTDYNMASNKLLDSLIQPYSQRTLGAGGPVFE